MSLSNAQRLIRGARRTFAPVALLVGLSAAVALHHGQMNDMGMEMDMHDAPMLVVCLGVAATAALAGWAAPPADPSWGLPVAQEGPMVGVPPVPARSSARDGPAGLQVFLT